MLFRTSRVRRSTLLTTLGISALALAVPAQSLAGPVHSVTATPSGLSGQSGNLVASLADNSIRTTGSVAAGHRAGFRYCPPWANSTVRTLNTRSTRWHATPHVGYLRVLGSGGEVGRITEAQQAYLDPVRSDTWTVGSPCATLEFYASGARTHAGIWTAQVVGATVEDQQGPSVTSVSAPQGWHTGSSAPITFTTGDNGLGQGDVSVSVGSAITNAGNLATGQRTVSAGLGGLSDGQHTVTVARAGFGWPLQSRSTQIRIDRNPPATPSISAGTTAWTSAPVSITAGASADGTGSGWKENQFSIDGGSWSAVNPTIASNGIHKVVVRAVDVAGNRSPTDTVTLKIDRVDPSGQLTKVRRVATGTVVATVAAADSLSGVDEWQLVAQNGAVLATGSGTGRQVVMTGLRGSQKLRLVVEDVAGNRTVATTTTVAFGQDAKQQAPKPPTLPADLGPAPSPMQLGVPRRGLAGARVQKGTPLPFWLRTIRGVGARRAYALDSTAISLKLAGVSRRARVGKRNVPLVRVTAGAGRRVVTGRFTTASGSRLPYPYVIVRDPGGDIIQTTRGGARGSFRLAVSRSRPGKWTVSLWGRPEQRFTVLIRRATQLKTSLRATTVRRHARLRVTGRVTPAASSRGRVVQLQWLDESAGQRKWRPVVNTRINRAGKLKLSYRFRRAGGYSVKMRVVVLGSPGSPSLRTKARTITVLP